jgi:hypothetical protein
MVAESEIGTIKDLFCPELPGRGRENMLIAAFPDPFHLVLPVPGVWHVMDMMASGHTLCAILAAFAGVDNHAPADFSRHGFLVPCRQNRFLKGKFRKECGRCAYSRKSPQTGLPDKISTFFVHHGVSMGDR